MKDSYFNDVKNFLRSKCPMPGHWCNGTVIPLSGRMYKTNQKMTDQGSCKFFDPDRGCLHPDNPKNRKKIKKPDTRALKEVIEAFAK